MNLRMLFVEDSADDVALMLSRLRKAGIEPDWQRVETAAALREAFAGEPWDLALVDFNLPSFSGPEALGLLAALAPDLPAITVSGAISEETAVATISAGAVDYVLKGNLTRLAPAVLRAVEGAELRREQRRAAAQALRTQFAIDHSSQTIAYVDRAGTILYVNAAVERLGDAAPDRIVGGSVWDWVSGFDAVGWAALWTATVAHPPVQLETTMRTSGDRESRLSVTLDYAGEESGEFVVVYARDISERRAAQEALRKSEAQLRTLVDTLPDLVWLKDPDGVYLSCNRRFESFFGAAEAEIVGKTDYDFMDAGLADFFRERDRAAAAAGEPTANEEEIVFADDGHREILETIKTPVLASDGALIGVLGVGRDITTRKRAEEELRQSEARLAAAQEVARVGSWETDLSSLAVAWSDETYRIFEVDRAGYGSTHPDFLTFVHPEDRAKVDAAFVASFDSRSPNSIEHRIVTPGGLVKHVEERWRIVADDQGRPARALGTCQDITERKQAEEEIRRQADQLRRTVEGAVLAMSNVVETRDPYTAGHERRVSELATAIAAQIGIDGERLEALRLAGLIHDVGKIAVPAEILSKPGLLSEVELNLIKQHPQAGFDILGAIDFGLPVAEMVLQHHERLDGSGYPKGLAGEDVLPEARILAVADVVEAMSSHRPYRAALGIEAALDEVRAHAGVKYDPEVVATCVRLFEEQGFAFME